VFEKLETAEEYAGQSATPDSTGNVEQMRDALSELSLGTAIRTAEDPRNLVRAEIVVDPGGLEVAERVRAIEERVFHYPEWNHKQGAYREGWVTLVEERLVTEGAGRGNEAAARAVLRRQRRHIEDIRAHLVRTLHRRQARDRQTDGPDIDVNAMVERHADLAAGRTPSDRLYIGARRALREIAILVLVDTSYSTDAWLQGRRVLDVEVESLLVLSAALEGLMEEEVAVASFRSHTRQDVRFGVLKGFGDSWAHLRRVAPGLEPEGYTRIGAALRHASAILEQAHARKKLVLLLSDGKPTDYDRYEGRYGVEDVSKAVREAGQQRIHCFGLAIEMEAKLHLARMLGPGSYRVLPRISLLPEVMADVFLGMLTG
jgi:nitric oxide reductase NorD protein